MPNDVTIPATGSGDPTPKVSTDQLASGAHVQLIKLLGGAEDDATRLLGTPAGQLLTSDRTFLFGDNLLTNIDATVWNNLNASGGTATVTGGSTTLATNTTANGAAGLYGLATARLLPGTTNTFEVWAKLDAATALNVRRFGPYDANNGFFWQLAATGIGVGSRRVTVDTVIAAGSMSPGSAVADTNWHRYTIFWGGNEALFFQDGVLCHRLVGTAAAVFANALDVPCSLENINSGGSTTAVNMLLRGFAVHRLGQYATRNRYRHFSALTNNAVLKLGAGTLKRVVVGNTGAFTLTLADNATTTAAGVIAVVSTSSGREANFDVDFNLGLVATLSGAADVTIFFD